jgi:hypothetical protein
MFSCVFDRPNVGKFILPPQRIIEKLTPFSGEKSLAVQELTSLKSMKRN